MFGIFLRFYGFENLCKIHFVKAGFRDSRLREFNSVNTYNLPIINTNS